MFKRCFKIISVLILLIFIYANLFAITEKESLKMKKFSRAKTLEQYIVNIMSIGWGLGNCSGVVVSNEKNNTAILTCKHCINSDFETYADNKKVISIHALGKEDLAYLILESPLENKISVILAKELPPIETKIYMLGRPGMTINYFKSGTIKRYTEKWGFAKLDVIGGCSGTGLFNKDNELVGIVWGSYKEGMEGGGLFFPGSGGVGIGIFEPITDIQSFLTEIKKLLNKK